MKNKNTREKLLEAADGRKKRSSLTKKEESIIRDPVPDFHDSSTPLSCKVVHEIAHVMI